MQKEFDPTLNTEKTLHCEICGHSMEFDFALGVGKVKNDTLKQFGKPVKYEYLSIGRDFFPLVGTMGSEAQIMSNMTKSFTICPRCLLMVNFLPFTAQVIEGRWALFNTGNLTHLYHLVKVTVKENIERIILSPGDEKFSNLGADDDNKQMRLFETLWEYYNEYQIEFKNPVEFLTATNLKEDFISMWKFTNSNQGAELEIQTLPNSFIQFTVLAAILRIQDNIRRILNQEAKSKIHPSKRLFNSIANHNWYSFEKYILIKKNKAKKSKSKSTRKKTTSLTDGIPNLLENNQNMLDPFIPLLYSVIVLDYKFEYLEKIIQIVDKINQIIPADQLPEREYVQLQIIIRNSIDEMIKNKSIDSNFLEKVFGYASEWTKIS